mmetsp:Transcript_15603/g.41899  ORF Transcript_15603/g.41899 Transcript_15603/m.41899 type:complete len:271 (+) Transcript_15603:1124-1936(+)
MALSRSSALASSASICCRSRSLSALAASALALAAAFLDGWASPDTDGAGLAASEAVALAGAPVSPREIEGPADSAPAGSSVPPPASSCALGPAPEPACASASPPALALWAGRESPLLAATDALAPLEPAPAALALVPALAPSKPCAPGTGPEAASKPGPRVSAAGSASLVRRRWSAPGPQPLPRLSLEFSRLSPSWGLARSTCAPSGRSSGISSISLAALREALYARNIDLSARTRVLVMCTFCCHEATCPLRPISLLLWNPRNWSALAW